MTQARRVGVCRLGSELTGGPDVRNVLLSPLDLRQDGPAANEGVPYPGTGYHRRTLRVAMPRLRPAKFFNSTVEEFQQMC